MVPGKLIGCSFERSRNVLIVSDASHESSKREPKLFI